MYPIRGAVTFKSPVGTNVASDALANLASGGVTGGALIIVGEDYGEGSSIMQERSHAFAMKSQIWLLGPPAGTSRAYRAIGRVGPSSCRGRRTQPGHCSRCASGACPCARELPHQGRTSSRPKSVKQALESPPARTPSRVVLPPASYAHERDKIERRLAACVEFINGAPDERGRAPAISARRGSSCRGGMYNGVLRALQGLGLGRYLGPPAASRSEC
jgi:indolepyruvate ferredoxin oxidoreductase alpha subunit